MRQAIPGWVRRLAPARPRAVGAAFCRAMGGALLVALASSCQQDGSPTGNRLTGSLALTISGIPEGGSGAVVVSGADGYRRQVTESEVLTDLPIGNYGIAASEVATSGDRYAPTVASQSITLTAHTVMGATVEYRATTGRIQLTVTGIPSGVQAAVQISGPGGFSYAATESQLIAGLLPGEYTLSTGAVTSGGLNYLAAPNSQPVTVVAGETVPVGVTYTASSGSLDVSIAGLPAGASGAVSISGPNGYSRSLTQSQILIGLEPGTYQVTAGAVTVGGTVYTPTAGTQSVTVMLGSGAVVQVTYTTGSGNGSLDFRIDGAYLTQSVQRYTGTVPLVGGRDAFLRVFVVANQGNSAQPSVRVRLYNGTTLVQTYLIPAPGGESGVPLSPNEGSLSNSWNVLVPQNLVQPGLRLLVDVDPNGTVPEADKSNNQFPSSGVPAPVDVRGLAPFGVRLVPVLQQVNGLSGTVTSTNLESFLSDLKEILPVAAYEADLHAVYTTTAPALQSNNGNNAWNMILSELLALRTADASSRYYYGVVKTSYTSGVAGMGYVGGGANTALGWDFLPSASHVMAHEIGHTMGRQHAPCGSVAGPDPEFPYPGGSIGVWGLALNGLVLKSPNTSDLMGYCQPSWISDYTWTAMINYRQSGSSNVVAAGSGTGLLVWGRIAPGGVILEPAFQVPVAANGPGSGPNQLELLAADRSVLRTIQFDAAEIGDLPGSPERQFAFVVPVSDLSSVAGLRVRAGGFSATRFAPAGGDPNVALSRVDADRISVRWNATDYPMVMVRDASNGRVLSFARGGNATLWSRAGDLDLQFSNGTRTVHRRERILK